MFYQNYDYSLNFEDEGEVEIFRQTLGVRIGVVWLYHFETIEKLQAVLKLLAGLKFDKLKFIGGSLTDEMAYVFHQN